ncbi:unnamed protein product [Rotaria sp. Silwood1]|nr:unnamed protein product [Rotaria sp. Silwood1]
MERMIDDIIDQISSVKCFHSNVTCLLNLPNKILLMIYRYLSVYGVLHCFYTSERSNSYLHDSIHDYYTKIYLGVMSFHECDYLLKLFLNSDNPLRSKSLILNNEHGFYLDRHYFFFLRNNIIQSIFIILTHLTVINCTFTDFDIIARHYEDFTKLEYLYATILKLNNILHYFNIKLFDNFNQQISLIPHQGLRHFNIILQTIDDLYALLSGLIPNNETFIVQLHQSRLSTCYRSQCQVLCSRLIIDFTLLESSSDINLEDMESILIHMPNLRKLTLSIRDTLDSRFVHELKMESMLIKHVPHLDKFD